jgi:CheY-like chemotaxis protein
MPEPCTVLIAPREVAARLDPARPEVKGELLAFAESEPLEALEAIVARRPATVVLDREFASTARGLALVDRIRTDGSCAPVEVLLLDGDGQLSAWRAGGDASDPAAATAAQAAPPDYRGTRRATRVPIQPGVEILIDGKEADLVDLSLLGAQVLSATVIRPNKPVRVVMPEEDALLKLNGLIVWSRFEMPPGRPSPRYRAGIVFSDPDPDALSRYAVRRRKM